MKVMMQKTTARSPATSRIYNDQIQWNYYHACILSKRILTLTNHIYYIEAPNDTTNCAMPAERQVCVIIDCPSSEGGNSERILSLIAMIIVQHSLTQIKQLEL